MDAQERMELAVRTAAKLSPEDRHRVAERILDVKDEPVLDAGERCAALVSVAEQALGCTMDRSRSATSVAIRRFVSWRMRQDGYSFNDIARAMGVNHSTVHYYVRMMRDEFEMPSVFRNDVGLYHKFNEMLDNNVEQVRE